MMMWYFLVSDALTFGGLLIAYGVSRHEVIFPWPIGEQVFEGMPVLGSGYPLMYVALMTFILIVSSVTMVLAVEAGHRNHKPGVVRWLGWTIVGGFFFLGSQAWEWSHFIHGSGGAFKVAGEVTVTATLGSPSSPGETMTFTLKDDDMVFFDGDFGHEYEHAMHAGDHADEGHDAHGHEAHGHEAEGEGHGEDAHVSLENLKPEILILNKYTENKAFVQGAELEKIWKHKGEDTEVFGANLSENEYGPQQYANFFFFVTGFHGFHVFSGVLINIIVFLMVIKGVFEKRGHYEMVEKIGLYWHFVDLVWVFVFTFFYLV
ncbi:MAG: cytochrome c oxidase subunit 3 [Flavobacteriales bacterium]|nr:cytochrome c oxidase subunit 3 [Flavobacteriales bacterium]